MKRAALLGVALALASGDARAAGFYVGDLGAKGMARGGAFVADPDSLLALHYNPAGLAGQRGLLLEADLSLLSGAFSFARHCPCVYPDRIADVQPPQDPAALDAALQAGFDRRAVENQAGFRPIPFIGVGYGLPFLDLTVAAGVYGPHGAAYDYGVRDYADAVSQPQRYSLIEASSVEANYQLGAALSPLPGLKIGASLILYQTKSTQFLHIYANTLLTPFAENVSTVIPNDGEFLFDIPIELSFEKALAINWSLGASYEVLPGLSLGASFRGPRSVSAAGSLRADLPPILSDAMIAVENGGGDVNVSFNLPAIARVGAQFRMPALFAAEVALVWEGWSTHENVTIQADAIKLVVQNRAESLGTLVLDRHWQNTVSLRLGAELLLLEPWLAVTAGYYYEPSAIPDERLQASTIDLPKHGLSLGLRSQLFGFTLQLALAHVRLVGKDVSNSSVEVPAPIDIRSDDRPDDLGSDRYLTRIGNGRYDGSTTIASLSLAYAFEL